MAGRRLAGAGCDERKEKTMRRGDIYCNRHASVVEVVYLTRVHKKKHLPTHVRIRSSPHASTALCEQVYTVHKERLGRYMGHINHAEQTGIDWALHISLGLE